MTSSCLVLYSLPLAVHTFSLLWAPLALKYHHVWSGLSIFFSIECLIMWCLLWSVCFRNWVLKCRRLCNCFSGVSGIFYLSLWLSSSFCFDSFPSPFSSAVPSGVLLPLDGKARWADGFCGGERYLPEEDVTPAGLLLPLQRRAHRHQEEKVGFLYWKPRV